VPVSPQAIAKSPASCAPIDDLPSKSRNSKFFSSAVYTLVVEQYAQDSQFTAEAVWQLLMPLGNVVEFMASPNI